MRIRRWAGWGAAGALYLTLCWRPLFWGGLVPVDGNVIAVTYPNWALAHSLWTRPRWPLWNPARGLGVPHAADPITSALYPPMLALSAGGDFPSFLRSWIVLHTLLACAFAAAWAWRRLRDPWAAAAAALAAGFNGFFLARVVFTHQFASAAWLPAALFFLEDGSSIGLGCALALQWLAGYPPFSLLTGLFLAALAFEGGPKKRRCLLQGGGLALALAAVQLLPFLEFLALSSRGGLLDAREAAQFSLGPAQLAKELLLPQWTTLSPELAGDPAIVGFYAGPVLLALAAWALRRRRKGVRAPALLLAGALILSLGGHLPGFSFLKPLHAFRYPANWLLPAWAAVMVLAAEGAASLPSKRWKTAALAAAAIDLLFSAQAPRTAWARPQLLSEVPPAAAEALKLPQPCRVYHEEPLMRLWASGTLESEEDYVLMRDFLAPDYGMALGLQGVSDWQTLRLRSAEAFRARLAQEGPRSPLLDWAGACVVVGLGPEAVRVERRHLRVRVNPLPRGRVFVPDDPSAQAALEEYSPGRARARVRLSKAGEVVLAENRYPGWQAEVDGAAAPRGTFAGTFLSVPVPLGEHLVEFRFRAWSFWFGLAVTLSALGLLLAYASGKNVVL